MVKNYRRAKMKVNKRRISKANPRWDGDGVQGIGQRRDRRGRWARQGGPLLPSFKVRSGFFDPSNRDNIPNPYPELVGTPEPDPDDYDDYFEFVEVYDAWKQAGNIYKPESLEGLQPNDAENMDPLNADAFGQDEINWLMANGFKFEQPKTDPELVAPPSPSNTGAKKTAPSKKSSSINAKKKAGSIKQAASETPEFDLGGDEDFGELHLSTLEDLADWEKELLDSSTIMPKVEQKPSVPVKENYEVYSDYIEDFQFWQKQFGHSPTAPEKPFVGASDQDVAKWEKADKEWGEAMINDLLSPAPAKPLLPKMSDYPHYGAYAADYVKWVNKHGAPSDKPEKPQYVNPFTQGAYQIAMNAFGGSKKESGKFGPEFDAIPDPHHNATHNMTVENKKRAVENISKHLEGMDSERMRKAFDLIPFNDKGAEYSKYHKVPFFSDYQFSNLFRDLLSEEVAFAISDKALKERVDSGDMTKSEYYKWRTETREKLDTKKVSLQDTIGDVEPDAVKYLDQIFTSPENHSATNALKRLIIDNWDGTAEDPDTAWERFVGSVIPEEFFDESQYGTKLRISDEKYPTMIAQAVVDGWARSSSGFLSGILQQRAREIFEIDDAWKGNWVSIKGGEAPKRPVPPQPEDFGAKNYEWPSPEAEKAYDDAYDQYVDDANAWDNKMYGFDNDDDEHFGVPYWDAAYSDAERIPQIYEAYPEMWDRIVTGVYEDTQREFERRGITELFLHRGMDINSSDRHELGDDVDVRMQPLSSWSDDPEVTKGFGQEMYSSFVDVRDVWSSAFTGLGCTNEGEFVLLGGLFEATVGRVGSTWASNIHKRRIKQRKHKVLIDIDSEGNGDWIKRVGVGDILISGNPAIFNGGGFAGHPRRIVKAKNPTWDGDGVQGVGQNRGKGGRWAKQGTGAVGILTSAAERAAEARAAKETGVGSTRRQPIGTDGHFDHKKKSIADTMKIKKPQKGSTHVAQVSGKEIPRKTKYTPEEAYYHRNNGPSKISNDRLREIFEDRSKATQAERDLVLSASSDVNFDGVDIIEINSARFKGQTRDVERYVLFKNLKTGLTQDYAKKSGAVQRGIGGQVRINTGDKAVAQNKKDSVKRANNQRNTVNVQVRQQMLADYGDGNTAKCIFCGGPVTLSSISPERMKPGPIGGKYERGNIAPAHVSCNTGVGTDAQKKPDDYYDKMMKQFLKMYADEISKGRLGTVFGKHRGKLRGKRPGRAK